MTDGLLVLQPAPSRFRQRAAAALITATTVLALLEALLVWVASMLGGFGMRALGQPVGVAAGILAGLTVLGLVASVAASALRAPVALVLAACILSQCLAVSGNVAVVWCLFNPPALQG